MDPKLAERFTHAENDDVPRMAEGEQEQQQKVDLNQPWKEGDLDVVIEETDEDGD